MKSKVKFTSRKYITDYIEEKEDQLIIHPRYLAEEKEVEATILEERKYTYRLKLDDGNVIIKKKRQVE